MKLIALGFGAMLGFVFTETPVGETALGIYVFVLVVTFFAGWRLRSDRSVAVAVASAVAKAEAEAKASAMAAAKAEFSLHLHDGSGATVPEGPAVLASERSEDTRRRVAGGSDGELDEALLRWAMVEADRRRELVDRSEKSEGDA